MKYIKQFGIILMLSFIGEILHALIPLPVPASIYGIIILFICLKTKIISLKEIQETGKFLIEIMPLMFIPAAVGLLDSFSIIRPALFQYLIMIVVSTILVMAVAGRITQFFIRHSKSKKKEATQNHE
ncbi:MAG: CidA/LrgA family protein [Lachnospiraceae bacterium]|nr:CidA/LrgA family protein [Lachnospiraceae bacterium]